MSYLFVNKVYDSLFQNLSTSISKIHPIILQIFFPKMLPSLKVYKKFPGRRLLSLPYTRRSALPLMAKSSSCLSCQNGLCSHWMQVRFFCLMDTYKYFNMEVRQLTNNVKPMYINVHHWEVDLPKPTIHTLKFFST